MPRTEKKDVPGGQQQQTGSTSLLDRWKTRGASSDAADWSSVDGRYIAAAAAALGTVGGAIRLGYTRDGGAYAIGVYLGKDSHTDYLKPGESVEDYLRALVENFAPHLL